MKAAIRILSGAALGLLCGIGALAQAQQEVKIAVIYPLTGAAASTGAELKNGAELAADIVNNGAPGIPNMPFAAGGGLPGLKGAHVRLIYADHQGNPQTGQTETERLITEEKVAAVFCCYFSNVTVTASQMAERRKIPFVASEPTSPALTARGFRYFFRTTPNDALFITNFYDFLKDIKARKNIDITRIGVFNENTLFGTDTTKLETQLAQERGYNLVRAVNYPAKSTQLTSEVQSLKAADPQVVMQTSYLGDAILSMKTYKELGFSPQMILANDAGFSDTQFIGTLGKDAEYIISREVWSLDLQSHNPLIGQANTLYRSRYKANFTGNSARSFTGMMVLLDAINRAGNTDPEAIRKALAETDIPGSRLIMPWKGVRFDESGQNVLGAGILVQIRDGAYHTVWPFDLATREMIWPMPAWDQRK
jgi:branched-chain amino acid transport system substrate-binding protein